MYLSLYNLRGKIAVTKIKIMVALCNGKAGDISTSGYLIQQMEKDTSSSCALL